eukprot:Pgem_evm1s8341
MLYLPLQKERQDINFPKFTNKDGWACNPFSDYLVSSSKYGYTIFANLECMCFVKTEDFLASKSGDLSKIPSVKHVLFPSDKCRGIALSSNELVLAVAVDLAIEFYDVIGFEK